MAVHIGVVSCAHTATKADVLGDQDIEDHTSVATQLIVSEVGRIPIRKDSMKMSKEFMQSRSSF